MSSNYERLRVYRLAVANADAMREAILKWPTFDRWTTGVQLLRSADSVGANLAEAHGRDSSADQRRFLYMARGSATETEHWLTRCVVRGLLPEKDFLPPAREVSRMLNGLINSRYG